MRAISTSPSGFIFTAEDGASQCCTLEGAVRLLQQHHETWALDPVPVVEAMERHDVLLRGIHDYRIACRVLGVDPVAGDDRSLLRHLREIESMPGHDRVTRECRVADAWLHAMRRGHRLDQSAALSFPAGTPAAAKAQELMRAQRNGRVHPRLDTLGCVTGRMSCSEPALQNLGKETRGLLIADGGFELVGLDWSHVEPSVAAILSGDRQLIDDCQPDRDLYQSVATALGVSRPVAKRAVLAPIYGQGIRGLAETLQVSEERARELRRGVFFRWPRLEQWINDLSASDGPLQTGYGRPLPVPLERYKRVNYACQGTARDLLTEATISIIEHPRLGADTLWLPVHDEIVIQVPEGAGEAAAADLTAAMTINLAQLNITGTPTIMGRRLRHS